MVDLNGSSVLITGGTGSLGKEIKEHHALSELQGVKVNLEMGL